MILPAKLAVAASLGKNNPTRLDVSIATEMANTIDLTCLIWSIQILAR